MAGSFNVKNDVFQSSESARLEWLSETNIISMNALSDTTVRPFGSSKFTLKIIIHVNIQQQRATIGTTVQGDREIGIINQHMF